MIEGTGLKAVFALKGQSHDWEGQLDWQRKWKRHWEGSRRLWNSWRNFHPWEEWKLGQELEKKEPDGSQEEGLGHEQREGLSEMDQTP